MLTGMTVYVLNETYIEKFKDFHYMTVYKCNPTNIIIIVFKKSKLLNNLNYFINNFKIVIIEGI